MVNTENPLLPATANLQPRLTVRQAATLMNVSERGVYKAMAVQRLRPDLAARMEAGTISTDAAYREATGRPKESRLDRLVKAWNACTDEERGWFYARIVEVRE